ncbi:MAG: DoxX family protein [Steroidobacteraceae bacterium]
MQRLFSTFPNSWPGGGLLLLRIVLAFPAVADGLFTLLEVHSPAAAAIGLVGVLTSALVLLGLWTPYAAAMLGLAQLWPVFFGGLAGEAHICRAAVAVSLVMLGPGAWSIDRLLFGRKRIDLPARQPGGH